MADGLVLVSITNGMSAVPLTVNPKPAWFWLELSLKPCNCGFQSLVGSPA